MPTRPVEVSRPPIAPRPVAPPPPARPGSAVAPSSRARPPAPTATRIAERREPTAAPRRVPEPRVASIPSPFPAAVRIDVPIPAGGVRAATRTASFQKLVQTARKHSGKSVFLAAYVLPADARGGSTRAIADRLVVEMVEALAKRGIEGARITGRGMGSNPSLGRRIIAFVALRETDQIGGRSRAPSAPRERPRERPKMGSAGDLSITIVESSGSRSGALEAGSRLSNLGRVLLSSQGADLRRLRIVRGSQELRASLYRALASPGSESDPPLVAGDTIHVPRLPAASGYVAVLGAVPNPGAYPVDQTNTAFNAFFAAGGGTRDANPESAVIVRAGSRDLVPAGLGGAMTGSANAVELRPGDALVVPPVQATSPAQVSELTSSLLRHLPPGFK